MIKKKEKENHFLFFAYIQSNGCKCKVKLLFAFMQRSIDIHRKRSDSRIVFFSARRKKLVHNQYGISKLPEHKLQKQSNE